MDKQLFLEDLSGFSDEQVRKHIATEYHREGFDIFGEPDENITKQLNEFDILIAYESVGSYGCDSSSFFLLQHKENKKYYIISGGHCSCYGFEGQFEPEETSLEYLKSDNFYFGAGGYDSNEARNREDIINYLQQLTSTAEEDK